MARRSPPLRERSILWVVVLAVLLGAAASLWLFLRSKVQIQRNERADRTFSRPLPRFSAPAGLPALVASQGAPDARADEHDPAEAERDAILTCWADSRCPRGSVCWLGDDGRVGCFASNCSSVRDGINQCGADESCETMQRASGIYRCVAAGLVQEGGSCLVGTENDRARSCARGLGCWRGRCRKTCAPHGTCEAGQSCVPVTTRDWVCAQGCQTNADCRGQTTCVALDGADARSCVRLRTHAPVPGCRPDDPAACASGERCDVAFFNDILIGVCRPTCQGGSCPADSTCVDRPGSGGEGARLCIRTCDPDGAHCPAGDRCVALEASAQTWGCLRMAAADRPGIHVERGRGHFEARVADPVRAPSTLE
jgi:hypothetical protein